MSPKLADIIADKPVLIVAHTEIQYQMFCEAYGIAKRDTRYIMRHYQLEGYHVKPY